MQLSITTDYARDTGDPEPYLRRIAEAGFSHIHWCHQWCTDFLYSQSEITQIDSWLKSYQLQLLDLHGSVGQEKNWSSPREYERLAGVELIQNRIEMTAQLGGDVVILHIPGDTPGDPLRKSLSDLEPFARTRGVRIAIENTGNFDAVQQVLQEYDPNYVGLCYDSGHGNVNGTGLLCLDALKDRLISVHFHDNDGSGDQHNLLFSGTIDWERLAQIISESSYAKCISMEVVMCNSGIEDEADFLKRAFQTGTQCSNMIEAYRKGTEQPDGAVTQESARSAAP